MYLSVCLSGCFSVRLSVHGGAASPAALTWPPAAASPRAGAVREPRGPALRAAGSRPRSWRRFPINTGFSFKNEVAEKGLSHFCEPVWSELRGLHPVSIPVSL